jgi:hypothetical protein
MADEAAVSPEVRQQRMKEFLSMLPLTMELAGLPKCEVGKMFTEGQMEVRIITLRNAYKQARTMLREIGETGS